MAGTFVRRERKHKRLAREGKMAGAKPRRTDGSSSSGPAEPKAPAASAAGPVKGKLNSAIFSMASAAGLITETDVEGMSRQKRKRFEKYLSSKLRKDETVKLIRTIEKEQQEDGAAIEGHQQGLFRSLKELGRQGLTKKEELAEQLRSWKAGIGSGEGLFEERKVAEMDDDEEDEVEDDSESESDPNEKPKPVLTSGLGTGLKRPLELDENGLPMITKRARPVQSKTGSFLDSFTSVLSNLEPIKTADEVSGDASSWEGFSDEGEADEEEKKPIIKSVLKSTPITPASVTEKKRVRWGDEAEKGVTIRVVESLSNLSDEEEGSDTDEVEDSEEDPDGESNGDSDDSNDSEDSQDENKAAQARRARASSFMAWATQQRNATLGFSPSAKSEEEAAFPTHHAEVPANFQPRAPELEPLPASFDTTTEQGRTRVVHSVQVNRPDAIQASRLQLPVVGEEQKIMEAVHNNDVTIICGATGSGKTTQVPQFLYESGYGSRDGPTPGMIAITQPRRVAAVSMAARVGVELGDDRKKVGYKIRFDGTVTADTAIKFLTEGVLLREMTDDFSLSRYSVVIVDEAHERGVNTDLLVGTLSRVVKLRREQMKTDPKAYPLKVIIMSATLRTSDFSENRRLFAAPPPVVSAEGRQHPVTMHFSRKTKPDYVNEIFTKLKRAHNKLPPGGILVFLTGQEEIRRLGQLLKGALPVSDGEKREENVRVTVSATDVAPEDEDVALDGRRTDFESEQTTDDLDGLSSDEEDEDEFDIQDDELDTDDPNAIAPTAVFGKEKPTKVLVLPLYSQLPTKQQLRVFEPPPSDSRLIVLATNVAETSITIPGIRFVFDSGRSKKRTYDASTGVQRLDIGWVSKAAASQRAGRAGRTGPGHCYRLYSSAIYEADFNQFDEPEIVSAPLEGVVLQLRSLGLRSLQTFPFPTPPDRTGLARAERLLRFLGALDPAGKVTPEGHRLAAYPLSPRLGRILLLGQAHGVSALSVAIVAGLAAGEIFVPEAQVLPRRDQPTDAGEDGSDSDDAGPAAAGNGDDPAADERRREYRRAHAQLSRWDPSADAIKLLTAVCAYGHAGEGPAARAGWAESQFLRAKTLAEATQLRSQLTAIIRAHAPGKIGPFAAALPQPSGKEVLVLKQIVAAGFIDQIAIRADLAPLGVDSLAQLPRKPRRVGEVPYLPLFTAREEDELRAIRADVAKFGAVDPARAKTATGQAANPGLAGKFATALTHFVFIHPSSVLAHQSFSAAAQLPPYLVFSRLERSAGPVRHYAGFPMPERIFMHPLTAITPAQATALANGTEMLRFGKPIGRVVDLEPVEGEARREAWVVPSLVGREVGLEGQAEEVGGLPSRAREWALPARRVIQKRDRQRGWVVAEVLEGVGGARK